MKYYLIKDECGDKTEDGDLYENGNDVIVSLKEDYVELTPDDYGLILDALYETRARTLEYPQEMDIYYAKRLKKVAKKFERIFKDEK